MTDIVISRANTIAEVLKSRLESVRKANGYYTNAGRRVYRGKRQLPEADCATLFESEEDAGNPRGEPYTAVAVAHFVAEAAVECDPDNPDIAGHKLVADLCRALFGGSPNLDGLLESPLTYTGRAIQPRVDGQSLVNVQIKLDATYLFTPANP
jgi:hypothetical protein